MTNFVSWINDVPGQSGALFAAAAAWKQVGQQIASAAEGVFNCLCIRLLFERIDA